MNPNTFVDAEEVIAYVIAEDAKHDDARLTELNEIKKEFSARIRFEMKQNKAKFEFDIESDLNRCEKIGDITQFYKDWVELQGFEFKNWYNVCPVGNVYAKIIKERGKRMNAVLANEKSVKRVKFANEYSSSSSSDSDD